MLSGINWHEKVISSVSTYAVAHNGRGVLAVVSIMWRNGISAAA